MKNLHVMTRIAADGMLHLPALEFANQQEIGFVGSLNAEADFSVH